jgi:hypothetical protein
MLTVYVLKNGVGRYNIFFYNSFKLETKIMNFMTVFFEKNIIKLTQVLSILCNTIFFTIFPLSGPFDFAEFVFVFID